MTERPAILQEREKTHGDFIGQASIWHRLLTTSQLPAPPQGASIGEKGRAYSQVLALHMIYVKISRILAGSANCKDHWDDIAGYAHLGAEVCDDK